MYKISNGDWSDSDTSDTETPEKKAEKIYLAKKAAFESVNKYAIDNLKREKKLELIEFIKISFPNYLLENDKIYKDNNTFYMLGFMDIIYDFFTITDYKEKKIFEEKLNECNDLLNEFIHVNSKKNTLKNFLQLTFFNHRKFLDNSESASILNQEGIFRIRNDIYNIRENTLIDCLEKNYFFDFKNFIKNDILRNLSSQLYKQTDVKSCLEFIVKFFKKYFKKFFYARSNINYYFEAINNFSLLINQINLLFKPLQKTKPLPFPEINCYDELISTKTLTELKKFSLIEDYFSKNLIKYFYDNYNALNLYYKLENFNLNDNQPQLKISGKKKDQNVDIIYENDDEDTYENELLYNFKEFYKKIKKDREFKAVFFKDVNTNQSIRFLFFLFSFFKYYFELDFLIQLDEPDYHRNQLNEYLNTPTSNFNDFIDKLYNLFTQKFPTTPSNNLKNELNYFKQLLFNDLVNLQDKKNDIFSQKINEIYNRYAMNDKGFKPDIETTESYLPEGKKNTNDNLLRRGSPVFYPQPLNTSYILPDQNRTGNSGNYPSHEYLSLVPDAEEVLTPEEKRLKTINFIKNNFNNFLEENDKVYIFTLNDKNFFYMLGFIDIIHEFFTKKMSDIMLRDFIQYYKIILRETGTFLLETFQKYRLKIFNISPHKIKNNNGLFIISNIHNEISGINFVLKKVFFSQIKKLIQKYILKKFKKRFNDYSLKLSENKIGKKSCTILLIKIFKKIFDKYFYVRHNLNFYFKNIHDFRFLLNKIIDEELKIINCFPSDNSNIEKHVKKFSYNNDYFYQNISFYIREYRNIAPSHLSATEISTLSTDSGSIRSDSGSTMSDSGSTRSDSGSTRSDSGSKSSFSSLSSSAQRDFTVLAPDDSPGDASDAKKIKSQIDDSGSISTYSSELIFAPRKLLEVSPDDGPGNASGMSKIKSKSSDSDSSSRSDSDSSNRSNSDSSSRSDSNSSSSLKSTSSYEIKNKSSVYPGNSLGNHTSVSKIEIESSSDSASAKSNSSSDSNDTQFFNEANKKIDNLQSLLAQINSKHLSSAHGVQTSDKVYNLSDYQFYNDDNKGSRAKRQGESSSGDTIPFGGEDYEGVYENKNKRKSGNSLAGIGKMLNIYDSSEPKNRKKNNVKQMNDYLLFLIVKANRKLDERLNAMFQVLQQIKRRNFFQQLKKTL